MVALLATTTRAEITSINIAPQHVDHQAIVPGKSQGPWQRVMIWECTAHQDIDEQTALRLAEHVRQGGALLLTMKHGPGTGPMRLGFMLPTMSWHTQIHKAHRGSSRPKCNVRLADTSLGMARIAKPWTIPYHYEIRPFHAVERGQHRNEVLAHELQYIDRSLKVGDPSWTRSLINRDWQVWAKADDLGQTPVLMSGRYGAGRCVVFASSFDALGPMTQPVLDWLSKAQTAKKCPVDQVKATTRINKGQRQFELAVSHDSKQTIPVEVVWRKLSWLGAMIDTHCQSVVLDAQAPTQLSLEIPKVNQTSYQELRDRDQYIIRWAILSQSGDKVLAEGQQDVDLRPALRLAIQTNDIRQGPENFPGTAGYDQPGVLNCRMGMHVSRYAYQPGQTVNAMFNITYGLNNIAPDATIEHIDHDVTPSLARLNDQSVNAQRHPTQTFDTYGYYGLGRGKQKLVFSLKKTSLVSSVTIVSPGSTYRNHHRSIPQRFKVFNGGKVLAQADDLPVSMLKKNGRIRIDFTPVTTKQLTLEFESQTQFREEMWLGEIMINAVSADPSLPAIAPTEMTVKLVDALTDQVVEQIHKTLSITKGQTKSIQLPIQLPKNNLALSVYRLEMEFAGKQAQLPLMTVIPSQPIKPLTAARQSSAPQLGFIVTRGFRNAFDIGTGTQQTTVGWSSPDDLVWAYAHGMKQTNARQKTNMSTLYTSEHDMRHYSIPWRSMHNGEDFFDLAAPQFLKHLEADRRFDSSDSVNIFFSDRWDTGPGLDQLYSWRDLMDFDQWLVARGHPGLKGQTKKQITNQIKNKYISLRNRYLMERYMHDLKILKKTFASRGKKLSLGAQGIPVIPSREAGELVASVLRGMSDDNTWGQSNESVSETTGRQMAVMAFNPVWELGVNMIYNWNSAVLNNPHWRIAVGTTEPSRRRHYDEAWRSVIDWDGKLRRLATFGYGANGGDHYLINEFEWNHYWRTQQRYTLLSPERALGVGVVFGSQRFSSDEQYSFAGGAMGETQNVVAVQVLNDLSKAISLIHDAQIPIGFVANVQTLKKWDGENTLIVLDWLTLTSNEKQTINQLQSRGVRILRFNQRIPSKLKLKQLVRSLSKDITFPEGVAGYGFQMGDKTCIVIEDWLEEGRTFKVRVRADPLTNQAYATELNNHQALNVQRKGQDWVIHAATRPGDGNVIVLSQTMEKH